MKTTTDKTSSALRHTITKILPNGDKLVISIRLGHSRLNTANGHADFAITGDLHEPFGGGWKREPYAGGCLHEDILKHAPELAPFVALHLSDQSGAPTYAIGNGFYFLHNDPQTKGRTRRQVAQEHLRATVAEMDLIEKAENETHLALIAEELGIPKRWAKEAAAARNQLEKWTGQNFAFSPTRSNYTPLTKEERAEITDLVKSGHFAPEKIAERKEQKERARLEKMAQDAKDKAAKKIKEAEDNLKVDLFMIANGAGGSFDTNWIYYDHANTLTFNVWDHRPKADEELIQRIREAAERNPEQLPEGIKVETKHKGR